jgi:hypothetical protein
MHLWCVYTGTKAEDFGLVYPIVKPILGAVTAGDDLKPLLNYNSHIDVSAIVALFGLIEHTKLYICILHYISFTMLYCYHATV